MLITIGCAFFFIVIPFQNGTSLWKILKERENVILCHVGLCLESKQLVPSAVTEGGDGHKV